MKKHTDKDISITHVSEKTVVTINGKEISIDGLGNENELMSLLKNNNLDSNMISQLMQQATNNNLESNANSTNNKFTKVDCSSCNRAVSYGKGNCMYCGSALTLKAETASKSTNEVDEKYLNTDKIETSNETTNEEFNFIDRLKDI